MAERRFGICTRYAQHELTHAAIHFAELALNFGIPTTLYSADPIDQNVSSLWDHKVITSKSKENYVEWIFEATHILWMTPPAISEVKWAKARGVATWWFVAWDELLPRHQEIAQKVSRIISPYDCVTRAIQQTWGNKIRFAELAWDTGLPITIKQDLVDPPWINVLFPLMDSQAKRSDQRIINIIANILKGNDKVKATVVTGTNWNLAAKDLLKWLKKTYPDRVTLINASANLKRCKMYAAHDLTVWSSKYEGIGTVGIDSLCMGTPVFAWNTSPQNEYLYDGKNALLVQAAVKDNWLGVPEIVPSWQNFEDALSRLLQSEDRLAKIRKFSSYELDKRRVDFHRGWNALWDELF